jgi:hypothetical protein
MPVVMAASEISKMARDDPSANLAFATAVGTARGLGGLEATTRLPQNHHPPAPSARTTTKPAMTAASGRKPSLVREV